ncbi:hypothetical protein ACH5RR_013859 [Cinchona calisaya]|uniref:Uncharacterized protein n=1 Tax=Cinchona calisaya TaxID=153742 RepID=A0ABD3A3V6_9GENT
MQQRNKKALREFVLALKTPNLIDSSYVVDQQRRFKTALKIRDHETARIANSSINSQRVLECDDDAHYDGKIGESIVFDFGDDYGNRADSNFCEEDYFYNDLDFNQTDYLVCGNNCITDIEDRKYSRDEIFNLSSLTKEDLDFFSKEERSLIH